MSSASLGYINTLQYWYICLRVFIYDNIYFRIFKFVVRILNLPVHIKDKQLPRWSARCLQMVTGSLYPVSIPLLPPVWGTRRSDPSIVTEGVINEGMTRARGEISELRTALLVWELREPRRRASKTGHLIASRQNTIGEPFTSRSTRHVTRGIRGASRVPGPRFSRQNSGRWLYNVRHKINELYKINEIWMLIIRLIALKIQIKF